MNTSNILDPERRSKAVVALVVCLGALVNWALVAWMFTSSQVIAPIPV
jgi:hypothetical protein